MLRVGLISDTHGLLRAEAVTFLQGCHHIIHGGDVGDESILARLRAIAPVTAVRGNCDNDAWAETLSDTELVELGGISVYTLHDLAQLDLDPRAAGVRVVVSGHSHAPRIHETGGVLYVNPGAAGPRRFRLPISVGELQIDRGNVAPRIVELQCE